MNCDLAITSRTTVIVHPILIEFKFKTAHCGRSEIITHIGTISGVFV